MSAKLVVMKFGGTSVGSTERMSAVAKRVTGHIRRSGEKVVVVVSAMSGETDRLIDLARRVSGGKLLAREYDQLLASGEQVSAALVAMAIQREGVPAASMLAHQVAISTKPVHGQNLISSIDTEKLQQMLQAGVVPVVAGFQGVGSDGSFTTLGRGGSDTTAVAVAAALGRCRCEILTDVDGVYTALPSICKKAKKLKALTYEEMLELASSGAKVLQARSVAVAYKHRVPLIVCSSFNDAPGTEIVEEYGHMEDAVVSGITCRTDEVKLTLRNVPDKPGVAAQVFRVLGNADVVVDMIVQSQGSGGKAVISLTVPQESGDIAAEALQKLLQAEFSDASLDVDRNIAKLSIVGEGMRTHAGVASKMFDILSRENINVEMITTSEIKISVAINQKYAELAVRSLHEAFIEEPEMPQ